MVAQASLLISCLCGVVSITPTSKMIILLDNLNRLYRLLLQLQLPRITLRRLHRCLQRRGRRRHDSIRRPNSPIGHAALVLRANDLMVVDDGILLAVIGILLIGWPIMFLADAFGVS